MQVLQLVHDGRLPPSQDGRAAAGPVDVRSFLQVQENKQQVPAC